MDLPQGLEKSVTLLGEELPVSLNAPAVSVSMGVCTVKVDRRDSDLRHPLSRRKPSLASPRFGSLLVAFKILGFEADKDQRRRLAVQG